jgi:sigma-B regulation protein RsbU (phosphoserine phosphatase)
VTAIEVSAQVDLQESFEDFFETSLCGLITANSKGEINRVNTRLAGWLGCTPDSLVGKRFADLLTIGGKIYFETHLGPLMRMQGFFDEVALELNGCDGTKIPVLTNGLIRTAPGGEPLFIRYMVFRATDRRLYERNLKAARNVAEQDLAYEREIAVLREQFIAVLGHDLRNPLGGVSGALSLLKVMPLDNRGKAIIRMAEDSLGRMSGLINDIMDFARGRLGSGMALDRQPVNLTRPLNHVVEEIKAAWPDREIRAGIDIPFEIQCDPGRICQLLSNLLANAITHGAVDGPVVVASSIEDEHIEVEVINSGTPIPAGSLARLFEPFTREAHRPSQNGLGLGLYIASQIAKAHGGKLWATSDEVATRFIFSLPR